MSEPDHEWLSNAVIGCLTIFSAAFMIELSASLANGGAIEAILNDLPNEACHRVEVGRLRDFQENTLGSNVGMPT